MDALHCAPPSVDPREVDAPTSPPNEGRFVKSQAIMFLLPGLLLGALGGYFFSEIRHGGSGGGATTSPRAAFLSSSDDAVDYGKLAQVCLSVAERARGRNGEAVQLVGLNQGNPAADPKKVEDTKAYLDRLMSNALERGAWTRVIAFRAKQLSRSLPVSDAADFARLVRSAVERGQLDVAPGAWVPEVVAQ